MTVIETLYTGFLEKSIVFIELLVGNRTKKSIKSDTFFPETLNFNSQWNCSISVIISKLKVISC